MFKSTYIHIIREEDYSMMFYVFSFQDVVVLCGLQTMNMYIKVCMHQYRPDQTGP